RPVVASARRPSSGSRCPVPTRRGRSTAWPRARAACPPSSPRAACLPSPPAARPIRARALAPACPCRPREGRGREDASSRPPAEGAGRPRAGLLEKAFVVPHEEVGLHLPYRIEGHADDDQETGAAEIERYVEPSDQEVREHRDRGE